MEDGVSASTVLVGIVAGVGGAVISTMLRIGYEREENLRHRLITAADEFSTALTQALLEFNDAYEWLKKGAVSHVASALDDGRTAMNDAHTRLGRVELLFGDESKAGHAAIDAMIKLRQACTILSEVSSTDELGGYTEAYDGAHGCHLMFCRAVRSDIRPWWKRRR